MVTLLIGSLLLGYCLPLHKMATGCDSTCFSESNLAAEYNKIVCHSKCRVGTYPRADDVHRYNVPLDKCFWEVAYPDYNPVEYTAPSVQKQPVWADLNYKDENFAAKWNELDGAVDRRSDTRCYDVDADINLPKNPMGRTGITGRGLLGRYGPNHAADPIVTRWKRTEDGEIEKHPTSGKPILQFISIQRKDSHEWAIPGGMVDPGEKVTLALKREFGEEAMNALDLSSEQEKEAFEKQIDALFDGGVEVYRGYVDDPRNTDIAWMETIAYNFHDEAGDSVGRLHLHAGDDAMGVRWTDLDGALALYASHVDFLQRVALLRGAHW